MALSNQEILDAIAAKSVLEISELIKMMEEKFGVSAAAAAAVAAAAAGGGAAAAAVEEQTEFTVMLLGVRREQGQRHQGGARADRPWPERGQRSGRWRAQARQGRREQGRRRRGEEEAGRRRRQGRNQVMQSSRGRRIWLRRLL